MFSDCLSSCLVRIDLRFWVEVRSSAKICNDINEIQILLDQPLDDGAKSSVVSRFYFFEIDSLICVVLGAESAATLPRCLRGGLLDSRCPKTPAGVSNGILLGDGTVLFADGGTGWYRLTPDATGSFANGTWTTLAKMHDNRLFYASQDLTNGNLFVCGGEYGSGYGRGEIYNPILNILTELTLPGVMKLLRRGFKNAP